MRKSRSVVVKAFLMVTQIGISMLVPIALGAWIGYQLDQWLETGFLFLVFLLFGIMAAFRNVYRMLKPFFAADFEKEKKQQAYWDALHPQKEAVGRDTGANQPEECGMVIRRKRERMADAVKARQLSEQSVMETSSRQKAEEEFDAWRRNRNAGNSISDRDECRTDK